MKAIVLAAGRGERMRPLTDSTPKPLLQAAGHPLIEYHLAALAQAGVREVVVNASWLADRLRQYLDARARDGMTIRLSDEGPTALETGGGIHQALRWLGPGEFLVVNGDVWTDCRFEALRLPAGSLAHLVLVPNPAHHPAGDFALDAEGRVGDGAAKLTYSGIGVFHPALFDGCRPGRFPLKPLLDRASQAGRLTGERYRGAWFDVGTPARLAELDRLLRAGQLAHPLLRQAGAGQKR